jgi:predicted ATPase
LPGGATALRGRRVLLVVDNAEHLPAARTAVANLARALPLLTVLVTSRAVLRLAGEVAYPVPPLDLPPATGPADRRRWCATTPWRCSPPARGPCCRASR